MTCEYVARPMRRATWNLVRDGRTIASADGVCRPDRRWFVSIDSWEADGYPALLAAVADDLACELHTIVDDADDVEIDRWRRLGFAVARREIEYVMAVRPALAALAGSRPPDGIVLLGADEVDERTLRELDDALREDVPGSSGWRNDPEEFHDYTFDERHFDPRSYLVAVDDTHRTFAGLVRVWTATQSARLGLIGVVPGYRRRGLARALLAASFAAVRDRGIETITAEADVTNEASNVLLESVGAVRTGVSVELVRPH